MQSYGSKNQIIFSFCVAERNKAWFVQANFPVNQLATNRPFGLICECQSIWSAMRVKDLNVQESRLRSICSELTISMDWSATNSPNCLLDWSLLISLASEQQATPHNLKRPVHKKSVFQSINSRYKPMHHSLKPVYKDRYLTKSSGLMSFMCIYLPKVQSHAMTADYRLLSKC